MDVMVTIRRQKMADDAYDSICTSPRFHQSSDVLKETKHTYILLCVLKVTVFAVCPVKILVKRPRGGSLAECARVYLTE